jgi:hypothetical protein
MDPYCSFKSWRKSSTLVDGGKFTDHKALFGPPANVNIPRPDQATAKAGKYNESMRARIKQEEKDGVDV